MPIEWEDTKDVKVSQEQIKKILPKEKIPAELGGNVTPRQDLNISDYTFQDWFRNYIADPLRGFVRMGGEAVGGAAGAPFAPSTGGASIPAGAIAAGTATDQLWQNTVGRLSSRTFGGPSPNFLESLGTSALEATADVGMTRGIPAVKDWAKNAALRKFASPNPNIPIASAIEANSDVPWTVGQTTQNKLAQFVQNLVVPEKDRDARILAQQRIFKGKANNLFGDITGLSRIPEQQQLAQLSSKSAGEQYKVVHQIRKDLYDAADTKIESSTASGFRIEPPKPSGLIDPKTGKPFPLGPPTLVPTQLIGPVEPTKTISFSQTMLKEIDDIIGDPNNANYQIPEVKAAYDALRSKVESFAKGNLVTNRINPKTGMAEFQPVMNYATAKADKDELNALFQKIPYQQRTRLAETVRTMRDLISQDIMDSADKWAPGAKAALERANEYHIQTFKKLYGPTLAKKLAGIGKYKGDPDVLQERLLEQGLSSPTIAQEIVNASGTKVPLAGEYVKRFLDASTDVNNQMMGTSGLKYLKDTKEIATKFLNADQRGALEQFGRMVQAGTYDVSGVPLTSILFRGGYMTMGIVGSAIAGNFSGSGVTAGLVLASAAWSKGALSKMMLNPANARLAAKLTKLAPGTPEATSIMKTLFRTGLRGVRFELQTATGEGLGLFEPQSDGKLHPVVNPLDTNKPIDITGTAKSVGWE